MRCRIMDTTWLWNTGQGKRLISSLFLLLLHTSLTYARPDFIDSMSRQFFGLPGNNDQSRQQQYQPTPDPFAQMFGSASAQVPQRPPLQTYQRTHPQQRQPPQRQGYFAPPSHHVQHQHPHHIPPHHQQLHPPYNGPAPVYGQQQGFGQREPNTNETKTVGYPPDNQKHHPVHPAHHHHQEPRHYSPVEYHQQAEVVEYPKAPANVVEYPPQHHAHVPHQYEYQHIPPQAVEVAHHEGPTLEIHTGKEHAYHEPPAHVEYHHPPQVEYHHHTPHKPKRFQLSYNEPSPEYKIIDKHLKLPPVKFRFHINPKIVITSNTKDPLDKKHHDDEHDLEPFPPPDAFSDPNAPPSYNEHKVEYYPQVHHYPVVEHVVGYPQAKHPYPEEHVVGYPQAKHPYPVEHHTVEHHPAHEYTYDLSRGHSHLNPHRSLGHYEPMFKVKTKAIIFTEPPPTRRTTTTTTARPTTSTARTTTTRATTTARPTRRARISARNPGFSVAFTQGSTAATTEASTTSSTTTRRSIFRSSSERERENGGISERKDELSTSAETSSSTQITTTERTTTTATPKPSTTTTTTTTPITTITTTTTPKPSTTTTTLAPISSSTTTTTSKPDTTTTTTENPTTVTTTTSTTARITTITTTQSPTTPSTTTTTTQKPTTPTTTTTTTSPTSRPTPAEETTPRTTTLSAAANEIDMRRVTEPPRRRPEPLQDESSSVERSESFNFESSESVKVIETTMLIDGKNQTVRFYYITEPVKLPLDVFKKMTGQRSASGVNVIKIRDKRSPLVDSKSDQDVENPTGL